MKDPYQKTINTLYNNSAQSFFEATSNIVYENGFLEKFQKLSPGKKVLDIWCGFWRDVKRLRENNFDALGIDASEKLVELADHDIRPYIQVWDMLEMNTLYRENIFDGILALASLVHLEKQYASIVFSHIHNLLKHNGVLFLSLKLLEDNMPEVRIKSSPSTEGVEKKYVYYSSEEIKELLKKLWFDIIEIDISYSSIDSVDRRIQILCKKI